MNNSRPVTIISLLLLVSLTLIFFWKILLTNLILSGVDAFLYFYPYKAYTAEALRQGRLPLWNPHLFMGAPLLANSQVGLFYPPNWLFIWLDAPKQVAWSIGLHIVLAGTLMMAFARQSLKLGWSGAMVAATLFAFGGYLGAQVEHINQLQAAAWLPLLFLLYDLGLRRGPVWFLGLAGIIALTLLAGHAQTVFISLFGLGLYALWQAVFEAVKGFPRLANSLRLFRSLAVHLLPLALASALGAALAAIQLLPTTELSSLSIRRAGLTFQEVVSFSLRPTVLHYSLLPPFNLDLTQPLGQAFSEWVAYLGLSGLLLALLGSLTVLWQPAPRRFLFVSIAGLGLSLGLYSGPIYLALYYLVPGFALFRVPARWLLLYAFGMAVLAGFGWQALLAPTTPDRLKTSWRWLALRRWRLGLPVLPILCLLALIAWRTPPPATLLFWLLVGLISLSLIWGSLLARAPLPAPVMRSGLALLLLSELFWAAQALNYNQPTAPQAFHSMRNSVAFLLAADPSDQAAPPGRFLSLSGITYDPGDLTDLRRIFGDQLPEQAVYDLVVATKEKEVLFFNLPLLYGLHSVDGYDGGILPLAQFVTFQKLFLPEDNLSIDGRLRENLEVVPANWLLSMINTRWIITDKQFDAWIDGIFYDLQFPARLAPGQSVVTEEIPRYTATAIGLVSHLEEAANLPDNSPVAEVIISFDGGEQERFVLRAGVDTAQGAYSGSEAHRQATVGVTWPYQQAGVDYISVQPLSSSRQISQINVKALLPAGQFALRGISLIHQPTVTSRSVLLSTEGDYRQVHSGDVKVYENQAALSRALILHEAHFVADEDDAIEIMAGLDFRPQTQMVVIDNTRKTEVETRGAAAPTEQIQFLDYQPEQVKLTVKMETPGWLLLTDSHYPGWQASVNGQPVEILQANLLFRAVAVPAGQNIVQFEFRPQSVRQGAWISGVTLLILIGAGWAKLRWDRKQSA